MIHPTSTVRSLLVFATLSVGALAAAACGSSGSDAAATASAEATSKPKKAASAKASASAKPTATAAATASGSAEAKPPMPTGPLPPVELRDRKSATFGGKEVSAEICKLDETGPMMGHESFDKAIRGVAAAPGGLVYVLDHEGKLRRYTSSKGGECVLTLDKGFGEGGILTLEADAEKADYFDTLTIDGKGDVYVSGFIAAPRKVSGGTATTACKDTGRLFVDTKGSSAFQRKNQVDLAADCKATEVKHDLGKEASTDMFVPFGADVLAAYSQKEKDKNVYKVALLSGGKKKWAVGDADGDGQMCNIGSVTSCGLGVCAVDANCRSLKVIDTSGKLLGATKINDLLGLSYPWPRGLSIGDGTAYMAATHKGNAKGDDRNYGMVFRIKGLN
jgi:hypothetical protein